MRENRAILKVCSGCQKRDYRGCFCAAKHKRKSQTKISGKNAPIRSETMARFFDQAFRVISGFLDNAGVKKQWCHLGMVPTRTAA